MQRGVSCAQVFTMANGFTQAYPMASKSQVHEALSLFHQREYKHYGNGWF